MANNLNEININPFCDSPIMEFDNSASLDVLGFDFDLFDSVGKSGDCGDDLQFLLSDLNNDLGHFSPSNTTSLLNSPANCLNEEELFRTALSVYNNAGKQPMNGSTTFSQNDHCSTVSGIKRSFPVQSTPAISVDTKIPITNPTVFEPVPPYIPPNRVEYTNMNGTLSAASMAAAMIAEQQAAKKKKTQHAPQRRNSKTVKKDEKSVLPAANVVSAETAVASIPIEKKILPFKDKVEIPPMPVIPGVFAPPPIPANDPRRNLCKVVMNAFHSCDIKKLREVLEQHGSANDEIVEVHRYEGIQNPHGRNYARIEGLENILQLWMALFKSAPDFCFDLFNHKTTYDPDWKVVVTCQYTMVGTRIMDVKISQPVAAADDSVDDCSDCGRSCTSTTTASHSSANSVVTGCDNNSSASIATASTTSSNLKVSEESLFTGKALVISNNSTASTCTNTTTTTTTTAQPSAKIYLDTTTTLKQPCQLRYKGKFSVFLDEFQKINKLEFVYTAMEEEMIGVPVAVPGKAVGGTKSVSGNQGTGNLVIGPSINRASVIGSFVQK